jgi:hypothetical protein
MKYSDLPDEIIITIFEYLTKKELLNMKTTSKRINILASSQYLWKNYTIKKPKKKCCDSIIYLCLILSPPSLIAICYILCLFSPNDLFSA